MFIPARSVGSSSLPDWAFNLDGSTGNIYANDTPVPHFWPPWCLYIAYNSYAIHSFLYGHSTLTPDLPIKSGTSILQIKILRLPLVVCLHAKSHQLVQLLGGWQVVSSALFSFCSRFGLECARAKRPHWKIQCAGLSSKKQHLHFRFHNPSGLCTLTLMPRTVNRILGHQLQDLPSLLPWFQVVWSVHSHRPHSFKCVTYLPFEPYGLSNWPSILIQPFQPYELPKSPAPEYSTIGHSY